MCVRMCERVCGPVRFCACTCTSARVPTQKGFGLAFEKPSMVRTLKTLAMFQPDLDETLSFFIVVDRSHSDLGVVAKYTKRFYKETPYIISWQFCTQS